MFVLRIPLIEVEFKKPVMGRALEILEGIDLGEIEVNNILLKYLAVASATAAVLSIVVAHKGEVALRFESPEIDLLDDLNSVFESRRTDRGWSFEG